MHFARRLEFSLAARYDNYNDFGATTNPKVGLLWEPVQGFDIRSSYGTSFRAPQLSQIGAPTQYIFFPYPNGASPTGSTDTLVIDGGNPGLAPEKSTSIAAGFDLRPELIPGLSFSATYFHLSFNERFSTPPAVGNTIFGYPVLVPFINLNPSPAFILAAFNSPNFVGDYVGSGPSGVTASFDGRIANIAATRESGVDTTIQYGTSVGPGRIDLSLATDWIFKNELRTVPSAPFFDLVNIFGETPKLKARAMVSWMQGRFKAAAFVNYVNGYQNDLPIPPEHIGSWTTGDLNLSYSTDGSNSLTVVRNVTVALTVRNVANSQPPFVRIPATDLLPGQQGIPFDAANASPVGRLISVSVKKA